MRHDYDRNVKSEWLNPQEYLTTSTLGNPLRVSGPWERQGCPVVGGCHRPPEIAHMGNLSAGRRLIYGSKWYIRIDGHIKDKAGLRRTSEREAPLVEGRGPRWIPDLYHRGGTLARAMA